jgi:hypothetical protein
LSETGCLVEVEDKKVDTEAVTKAGQDFLKANNNIYAKAEKPGFELILNPEEKVAEVKEEKKDEAKKEDKKEEKKEDAPKKSTIALLKENSITDAMFWTLTEDEIKDKLEVKDFGPRKKLMKRIGEINFDFTEAKEQEDL